MNVLFWRKLPPEIKMTCTSSYCAFHGVMRYQGCCCCMETSIVAQCRSSCDQADIGALSYSGLLSRGTRLLRFSMLFFLSHHVKAFAASSSQRVWCVHRAIPNVAAMVTTSFRSTSHFTRKKLNFSGPSLVKYLRKLSQTILTICIIWRRKME